MDFLFDTYSDALPRVEAWAAERFPRADGEPEAAHARSIRAKALDLLRGLLPAASLSHMGIFASGQAYEQLLLRLFASPLPEAHEFGRMILTELKAVMPSFVARVDRSDRGGEWINYLEERGVGRRALGRAARASAARTPRRTPARRCGCSRPRGPRTTCWPRCCSRRPRRPRTRRAPRCGRCRPTSARRCCPSWWASGATAATGPGRGFEALRYRFEVVSDYGAFRDLQRHRMLTIQWQTLSPDLGAGVPHELDEAGRGRRLPRGARALGRASTRGCADSGRPELAPYALCLGYRIRYVLDMNAREAMHLVELRSGREGHPGYRAVAHEIHAQIAAVHPAVAAAMTYVDSDTEPRLERILSEIRTQAAATSRSREPQLAPPERLRGTHPPRRMPLEAA